MARPYSDTCPQMKNAVDVIRHDDERVAARLLKVIWYITPAILRDPANVAEAHGAVDDVAEETGAIERADCHEIGSSRVIVAGFSGCFPVVPHRIH
jgi:hypothetical protein